MAFDPDAFLAKTATAPAPAAPPPGPKPFDPDAFLAQTAPTPAAPPEPKPPTLEELAGKEDYEPLDDEDLARGEAVFTMRDQKPTDWWKATKGFAKAVPHVVGQMVQGTGELGGEATAAAVQSFDRSLPEEVQKRAATKGIVTAQTIGQNLKGLATRIGEKVSPIFGGTPLTPQEKFKMRRAEFQKLKSLSEGNVAKEGVIKSLIEQATGTPIEEQTLTPQQMKESGAEWEAGEGAQVQRGATAADPTNLAPLHLPVVTPLAGKLAGRIVQGGGKLLGAGGEALIQSGRGGTSSTMRSLVGHALGGPKAAVAGLLSKAGAQAVGRGARVIGNILEEQGKAAATGKGGAMAARRGQDIVRKEATAGGRLAEAGQKLGNVAVGAVSAPIAAVPLNLLLADSPEQFAELEGGAIGIGAAGGMSPRFGRKKLNPEILQSADAFLRQEGAKPTGDKVLDALHAQYMAKNPEHVQDGINALRGFFNSTPGITKEGGINRLDSYVLGLRDFVQQARRLDPALANVSDAEIAGMRGYSTPDGKVLVNGDHVEHGRPGERGETQTHEIGHGAQNFLRFMTSQGSPFEAALTTAMRHGVFENGKPTAEFSKFIDNYKKTAPQHIKDLPNDHEYWSGEFLAETASQLMRTKGVTEFAIPDSIADKLAGNVAKFWGKVTGIDPNIMKSGTNWGREQVADVNVAMADALTEMARVKFRPGQAPAQPRITPEAPPPAPAPAPGGQPAPGAAPQAAPAPGVAPAPAGGGARVVSPERIAATPAGTPEEAAAINAQARMDALGIDSAEVREARFKAMQEAEDALRRNAGKRAVSAERVAEAAQAAEAEFNAQLERYAQALEAAGETHRGRLVEAIPLNELALEQGGYPAWRAGQEGRGAAPKPAPAEGSPERIVEEPQEGEAYPYKATPEEATALAQQGWTPEEIAAMPKSQVDVELQGAAPRAGAPPAAPEAAPAAPTPAKAPAAAPEPARPDPGEVIDKAVQSGKLDAEKGALLRGIADQMQQGGEEGVVYLDYMGAPKEEGAETGLSGAQRKRELAASPANKRREGGRHQLNNRAFFPFGVTETKNGAMLSGVDIDTMLLNGDKLLDAAKSAGLRVPYESLNDPQFIKDWQGYARNHANGWKGDGSGPVNEPGVGTARANLNYKPHVIPHADPRGKGVSRSDFINAMVNIDAAFAEPKGPRSAAKKAEAIELARQNQTLRPSGEVNRFREKLRDAGYDVEGDLEIPWRNLSDDMILGVRGPERTAETIRPHSVEDRGKLAAEGFPKSKFVAGGLMPAKGKLAEPGGAAMPAKGEGEAPDWVQRTAKILSQTPEERATARDEFFGKLKRRETERADEKMPGRPKAEPQKSKEVENELAQMRNALEKPIHTGFFKQANVHEGMQRAFHLNTIASRAALNFEVAAARQEPGAVRNFGLWKDAMADIAASLPEVTAKSAKTGEVEDAFSGLKEAFPGGKSKPLPEAIKAARDIAVDAFGKDAQTGLKRDYLNMAEMLRDIHPDGMPEEFVRDLTEDVYGSRKMGSEVLEDFQSELEGSAMLGEGTTEETKNVFKYTPKEPGGAAMPAKGELEIEERPNGKFDLNLGPAKSSAEIDPQGDIRLRGVGVAAGQRGKGSGRAFMEQVEARAAEIAPDAKNIKVWAFPDAQGFYEKLGFKPTGKTAPAGDDTVAELAKPITAKAEGKLSTADPRRTWFIKDGQRVYHNRTEDGRFSVAKGKGKLSEPGGAAMPAKGEEAPAVETAPAVEEAPAAPQTHMVVHPGDKDTIPVRQELVNGKPKMKDGEPVYVKEDYNLVNAPAITKHDSAAHPPEDATPVDFEKLNYDVTGPQQEKINAAIKSGAVDKMANEMVKRTQKAMENPDVAAGMGWYSRMRENLKKALGEQGRELLAQLLGATSAKTPVNENFLQAMDAYEGINSGRYEKNKALYNELLSMENEKGKLDREKLNSLINKRRYRDNLQKRANKIESDAEAAYAKTEGLPEKRRVSADKKRQLALKDAKALRDLANKPLDQLKDAELRAIMETATDMIPRRSNGAKFNANSRAVLKVIADKWLGNRDSPKTPNFAGNLSGRTVQATIDVWAARFLRQLMYEGHGEGPWRLQAKSETGVSNHDFALGQEVFRRAAKKLGMNPDDLQAVLWFAEKHNWDEKGWTGDIGAEKSSFDDMFHLFFPEGQPPLTFKQAGKKLAQIKAKKAKEAKAQEAKAAKAAGMSVTKYKEQQKAERKAGKLSVPEPEE